MSLLKLAIVGEDAFLPLTEDLMVRLGIKEGYLLEVTETRNGVLLTPVASAKIK